MHSERNSENKSENNAGQSTLAITQMIIIIEIRIKAIIIVIIIIIINNNDKDDNNNNNNKS